MQTPHTVSSMYEKVEQMYQIIVLNRKLMKSMKEDQKSIENRLSSHICFVKTLLTALTTALQITPALIYFCTLDLTFVAPRRYLFENNRK